MEKPEFIERIEKFPYPSMKFTYVENYFSKHGYDLFVFRPTNSDEVLLQVFTQDDFRTLIASYKLDIRNSLNKQLIQFFEKVKKSAKLYDRNTIDVKSRVELKQDTTIDLDNGKIRANEGQILVVGDKDGD